MSMTRRRHWSQPTLVSMASLLVISAGLSGCDKSKVAGQVIARVNGDDITDTELAQEGKPGPNGWRGTPTLETAIERKVVAQYARQQGLDKSPQYLLARRRMDETLLAQQVATIEQQRVTPPYPAEEEKYISDHPGVSSSRRKILVEEIQFIAPDDQKELFNQTKMESLISLLNARKIPARRSRQVLDTAMVPTAFMRVFDGLAVGTMRAVRSGKVVVYVSDLSDAPVPTTTEEGTKLAQIALLRDRRADDLQSFVHNLVSQAKIDYQASNTQKK